LDEGQHFEPCNFAGPLPALSRLVGGASVLTKSPHNVNTKNTATPFDVETKGLNKAIKATDTRVATFILKALMKVLERPIHLIKYLPRIL
jgi:hypothetical protein